MPASFKLTRAGNTNDGVLDQEMNRLFDWRQRKILQIIAGNMCVLCKMPLTNSFHADHIHPHSKGGWTITNNGQALCAACNLSKGKK